MEKNFNRYIAIIKQLENGKFSISFPDFEGITALAEKEESIEKIAKGVLKTKLQELKEENIEFPVPKSIVEVQKLLGEGEFTTYVSVSAEAKPIINKENLKGAINNICNKSEEFIKGDFKENVEKLYSKSEEVVKEKIGNNVKSENYHFIGMVGGIIYALSAFLPIITINIPFFNMKLRLGAANISDLKEVGGFVDVSQQVFAVRFIMILVIMSGIFTAYSAYRKHNFYFKSAFAISFGLSFAILIYVFTQLSGLEKEVREYVGFSYAWLGIAAALLLMAVSFILTNKKEETAEEKPEEEE